MWKSREQTPRGVVRLFAVAAVAVTVGVSLGLMTPAAPAQCLEASQAQRLESDDRSGGREFGRAIAVSGDTMIVGAEGVELDGTTNVGAAYIYRRANSLAPWALEATLKPDTALPNYRFGRSVAIDGSTAVVGAGGEVSIYTRSGTVWTRQQLLTSGGFYGFGVSVGVSGDRLVVGSTLSNTEGEVRIYKRMGGMWSPDGVYTPFGIYDDVPTAAFGVRVAISGDTIAVTQADREQPINEDVDPFGNPVVHIIRWSGSNWNVEQTVSPFSAYPSFYTRWQFDRFGESLALSGNTLIVGAPDDQEPFDGNNRNLGSAFVFTRSGSTWTQYQKIVPIERETDGRFGISVALSGTGYAAIGSDGRGTHGALYTFENVFGLWQQQYELTAPASWFLAEHQGFAVALTGGPSGGTAISAAYNATVGGDNSAGAVYSFRISSGGPVLSQTVVEPVSASAFFGSAVAAAGDYAVVGSSGDDINGLNAGAAHVLFRTETGWVRIATLEGPGEGSDFGASVDISADASTIVVGAPFQGANNTGAAWVFIRSGAGTSSFWNLQQVIQASDAGTNDRFGTSVSILGDTLAVGAYLDDNAEGVDAGSAYLYTRTAGTWGNEVRLRPSQLEAGDLFGISVKMVSSTLVAVGAFGDDNGALINSGAVYLIRRTPIIDGVAWLVESVLFAPDAASDDNFGQSIAAQGTSYIVIGALLDDNSRGVDAGSVYVWRNTGIINDNFTFQVRLFASDGAAADRFGSSVAMANNTIVVGVPRDDLGSGANAGSAFIYRPSGGTWIEATSVVASDSAAEDQLGWSVAVTSTSILVGSIFDDNAAGNDAGSVYIFDYSTAPPVITVEPTPVTTCTSSQLAVFSVEAQGGGPLTYRWYRNNIPLNNALSQIAGAFTRTLYVLNPDASDAGTYHCVVSNPCGIDTSNGVQLLYCPGDFNCSGTVTVQDLFDFLPAYFNGLPSADVNGSGGLSVQDLFDYLVLYFSGCV